MAAILIVDDEESLRFTFSAFLQREGHKTLTAADVAQALYILDHHPVDLVFSDILLGGRSGLDLLEAISARGLTCPVILITGKPDLSTIAASVRLGAFDYLPKPVLKDTLLAATRRALAHKALVDDKRRLEEENERYRKHLEELVHNGAYELTRLGHDLLREEAKRVKAQEALRESERIHRLLAENISDMIVRFNREGRILYVSPSARSAVGFEPEEILGRSMFDFLAPEDVAAASEAFQSIKEGPSDDAFLFRVRRKDGAYVWMETKAKALPGGEVVAASRDVSARKAIEDALRTSEFRLNEAQRIAALGSWEEDLAAGTFSSSSEFARLLGRAPDAASLTRALVRESILPKDRPRFDACFDASGATDSFDASLRFVRPDGEERAARILGAILRDASGRAILARGTFQDVTEQTRAMETQAKLSEFWKIIIDNANVLVSVVDKNRAFLFWNKAAERITGYSKEEVLGHNKIWEWVYPDEEYRRRVAAASAGVLAGTPVEDLRFVIRAKDGTSKTISFYSRHFKDEKGQPAGVVNVAFDVTAPAGT